MPDDGIPEVAPALHLYEAIADLSRQMVEASRADDWPRVGALEDQCRAVIATMMASAAPRLPSRPERQRRIDLLRAILANDAIIRARSAPWLRQLENLSLLPPDRDR